MLPEAAKRLALSVAESLIAERDALRAAIIEHRSQKADDRCIEDDDRLYAVLGDGIKCDRRVGDKAAMLVNCQRFIDRRCEGGGWPTYAELEAERDALRAENQRLRDALAPFARAAAGRSWITSLSPASGMDEMNIGGSSLTNGHLRAALEAVGPFANTVFHGIDGPPDYSRPPSLTPPAEVQMPGQMGAPDGLPMGEPAPESLVEEDLRIRQQEQQAHN